MRTAILYGGRSGEHEVSCLSAASVLKAIDRSRFAPVPIGIDPHGNWFLQDLPPASELEDSTPLTIEADPSREITFHPRKGFLHTGNDLHIEIVFPVLHGTFGEDGTVQGLLDLLDLPYVGSGVVGSAVSMDKDLTKKIWERHGLPVVPYQTLYQQAFDQDPSACQDRIVEEIGLPAFVKPARGGSSVGVYKAHNRRELADYISQSFRYDTKLLIEQYIPGIEIECSILGNHSPQAFPPASIESTHEYYDYEAKYQDPQGARFAIPAQVPEHIRQRIVEMAQQAFRAVEARGLSRVDFFFSADQDTIYLNEINTMPGFTAISLFPRMCAHDGLGYTQLITRLITLAQEEHRLRSSLKYQRN